MSEEILQGPFPQITEVDVKLVQSTTEDIGKFVYLRLHIQTPDDRIEHREHVVDLSLARRLGRRLSAL